MSFHNTRSWLRLPNTQTCCSAHFDLVTTKDDASEPSDGNVGNVFPWCSPFNLYKLDFPLPISNSITWLEKPVCTGVQRTRCAN